ncbi:MAG: anti-sigma regulatory factor [Gallionella sp.]|nr:anti-sigma regulatory factor [Gallionella sp.]
MMTPLRSETLPVREASDILLVRQLVRECATELGFSVLDQTKLVTAASELGRNTLIHGGGGTMRLETVVKNDRRGLRLTFEDKGPGIADLAQAMTSGFTTKGGMGLGLGGSKRLVEEFEVVSRVGEGTRVTATRWA